jgi:hypothetical protein
VLAADLAGGTGRMSTARSWYSGRSGVTVLSVNHELQRGANVVRTAQASPLNEDLRTGIVHAGYKVAFEMTSTSACAVFADDRIDADPPCARQPRSRTIEFTR